MFVSEDGTVTGSINVARLEEIEPKTDEARAQLEQLKADAQAGQEQAARDADRLAEQAAVQDAQLRGASDTEVAGDTRDAQGKETEGRPQGGTVQQAEADAGDADSTTEASGGEQDVKALQAEAEAAGVTVDKRWGADRLRQEIDQSKSQQASSSRKQR